MPKSASFRFDLLSLVFRGWAIPGIADTPTDSLTSLSIAAHTDDPIEAGMQDASEATYAGYARVSAVRGIGNSWSIDTVPAASPGADVLWPLCVSGDETLTHFSIGRPDTGQILYSGPIWPPIVVSAGVQPGLLAAGTRISEGFSVTGAGLSVGSSTVTGISTNLAPATPDLTATITYNGVDYLFDMAASDAIDRGIYVDPQDRFSQGSVEVNNAGLPAFRVLFRKDRQAGADRDEVIFELGEMWDHPTMYNMTEYTATIRKAGTQVHTETVAKHWFRSRWRWQSAPRPVTASVADLITAGLLPNYQASAIIGTPDDPGNPVYTPMSLAGLPAWMGATGEWPYIGPVTDWQARYLISGDPDDFEAVRVTLEASGTYPWHYRDERTGGPLDINTYPNAGAYGTGGFSQNPYIGQDPATGITMDTAHIPSPAYVPFVLTGDPYALEEMQFADCFALVSTPPASRGLWSLSQTRGLAWTLRTRAQLCKVTPVDVPTWLKPRSYFKAFLDAERDWLLATFVNSSDPEFTRFNLLISGLNSNPETPIPGSTYFAPWEQDFCAFILGWVVNMGFTDWVPIHDYSLKNNLARTAGTSGWPKAIPSPYRLQIKQTAGSDWVADWPAAWALRMVVSGDTDPVTIPPGNQTFPAYARGVLAMAAHIGNTDAAAAYDWLDSSLRAVAASDPGTNQIKFKWSIAP